MKGAYYEYQNLLLTQTIQEILRVLKLLDRNLGRKPREACEGCEQEGGRGGGGGGLGAQRPLRVRGAGDGQSLEAAIQQGGCWGASREKEGGLEGGSRGHGHRRDRAEEGTEEDVFVSRLVNQQVVGSPWGGELRRWGEMLNSQ